MQKKIPVIAATALFFIVKEFATFTLFKISETGITFISILPWVFSLLILLPGVVAVGALGFNKLRKPEPRFMMTFKALLKVGLFLLGFILAVSVLTGLIASLLQGILKSTEKAKTVTDIVSMLFSVVLIPICLHLFFSTGISGSTVKESFGKLKEKYLFLLAAVAVLFGAGRLLSFLSVPYLLNVIVMFILYLAFVLVVCGQYIEKIKDS